MKKTDEKKRSPLSVLKQIVLLLSAVASIYAVAMKDKTDAAQADSNQVASNAINSPNLKSSMIADSLKEYSGLKLQNTGLGPLTIKDVAVFKRNSQKIENTSFAIQEEFNLSPVDFILNPIHPKDALKEGEERWILKAISKTKSSSQKVIDVANDISIAICYCSLNDQCHMKIVGVQKVKPSMQC